MPSNFSLCCLMQFATAVRNAQYGWVGRTPGTPEATALPAQASRYMTIDEHKWERPDVTIVQPLMTMPSNFSLCCLMQFATTVRYAQYGWVGRTLPRVPRMGALCLSAKTWKIRTMQIYQEDCLNNKLKLKNKCTTNQAVIQTQNSE